MASLVPCPDVPQGFLWPTGDTAHRTTQPPDHCHSFFVLPSIPCCTPPALRTGTHRAGCLSEPYPWSLAIPTAVKSFCENSGFTRLNFLIRHRRTRKRQVDTLCGTLEATTGLHISTETSSRFLGATKQLMDSNSEEFSKLEYRKYLQHLGASPLTCLSHPITIRSPVPVLGTLPWPHPHLASSLSFHAEPFLCSLMTQSPAGYSQTSPHLPQGHPQDPRCLSGGKRQEGNESN